MTEYRRVMNELKKRKEQGINLFYPKGELDLQFLYDIATTYNMHEDESNIESEFDMAFDDMIEQAEEWDDRDPDFPYNPYHSGWELNGYVFICSYCGEAGRYWDDEFYDYPVCRP